MPSPSLDANGRPFQGDGVRGEGVTGNGNSETGIRGEENSETGPSVPDDKKVNDEESVETGASGIVGGENTSEMDRGYLDDAPVTLPPPGPEEGSEDAERIEAEIGLDENVLFGGSDGDVVVLPGVEIIEMDEDDFDPENVDLVTDVASPIDVLRGAWLQVSDQTEPDFALGGTMHRVLAINPAAKGLECLCFFGDNPRETYYGRFGFVPLEDSFFFRLEKNMNFDRSFDPGVTQTLMGSPILQPVLGEGDVIPFEVLEDAGRSQIRIGGRTYTRINAETFEGLRAGSLPLPEMSSEIDGGGGDDSSTQTRFFGIEATGNRICFICDGSGSMSDHFPRLQAELVSLVRGLPETEFVVMYFSGNTIGDLRWRKAGPQSARWLQREIQSMSPGGGSDPVSAFEIALSGGKLRKRPDMIFLMTDGAINPQVSNVLSRLNGSSRNRTRIHTIGFGSSGHALLKKIAAGHGGQFKVVSP